MDPKFMPLVTIITPSYNQGEFIQETIESVLNQDYPYIEHIVVDGGSTDSTLTILKSYRDDPRFHFISEPDQGQSHAINKGLKIAKGDIIGWLNSDDTYLPGAISKGVQSLVQHQEWAMVYGKAYATNQNNDILHDYPVECYSPQRLFERCIICQPATFIRRKAFKDVGGVDENFFFCMDYDLWIRLAKKYPIGYLNDYLANARIHDHSKSALYWEKIGVVECIEAGLKNYGKISNTMIADFIKVNSNKEEIWWIEQMKKYGFFPSSLSESDILCKEIDINNHHYDLSVNSNLSALGIKGTLLQSGDSHLKIYFKGELVESYSITKDSFILTLPSKVMQKSSNIQPLSIKLDPSTYHLDHIYPLSVQEYAFLQQVNQSHRQVKAWLKQNRPI
ncbi:glycosyltransferase [Terrilactibacillus sp. BCM23-1]|uniref:Glycosyltransferase n=1 Tax=Terrilactibacillus tamarindi TaxID=2599694 RepID=A0A6N8CP25_9BACI|nr:glycosyltransferase family 2 protein [Terrilactibacillus tamarindi]MTT30897.1 glycosyltransferase [Terrilactibacillus tamarindi]